MDLHDVLDKIADRIAADGTHTESRTLQAMAAAARPLCPGAAAALVDLDGSEIARLRAFGIVHGILLRDLPATIRAQLETHLLDTPPAAGPASGTEPADEAVQEADLDPLRTR